MDVERYKAAMVLSGVGDALGYKGGSWEFNHSGKDIHKELKQLGGLEKIQVKLPTWLVSDDTVMHLATGEALVIHGDSQDKDKLYTKIASNYKLCMRDMIGRAPGMTCVNGCHHLRPLIQKGYQIPFNPRGGGCGAAMRAMCIGLRYPREEDLDDLIAVSIESGRMTHHHPTGYLGALASALFTAYSLQGRPVKEWGAALMKVLPKARDYVKDSGHDAKENLEAWNYFTDKWTSYLELRKIIDGETEPEFPKDYGIAERDAFYKSVSSSGWGGASGHDAPMIAYDALLGCGGSWPELCNRSMFHGGDSDSTGVIAACCYGAMHGYHGVSELNYKNVEYKDRLENVAEGLYKLSHPSV